MTMLKDVLHFRKSLDNAIYWYKKAVENGYQEAKESLDILLRQQENLS